jgi:LacI family transcriptional regulator/LacI family repressor for deo operon, udp, cdd, tsx, nupC, and nupG
MPPEGLRPDEHVVLIESRRPRRSSVRFDSEAAPRPPSRTCSSSGHRRIGHLAATSTPRPSTCARRPAGACWRGRASIPTRCRARVTQITIDDARDAAGPLLDEEPTAVFCDDDIVAAGLYLAARERGCASRATSRSSASTTWTSRACSSRR